MRSYLRDRKLTEENALSRRILKAVALADSDEAIASVKHLQLTGVGLSALLSAGVSYVVLVVAAHQLDASDNAIFLTYWALLFGTFGVLTGVNPESSRATFSSDLDPTAARPKVVFTALGYGICFSAALGLSGLLWSARVLDDQRAWLVAVVALAGALYSGNLSTAGVLASRRQWRGVTALTLVEAAVRMLAVGVAAVTSGSMAAFACAGALPAGAWLLLLRRRDVGEALTARVDTTVGGQVMRFAYATTASTATAALVVGFPLLLRLTTDEATYLSSADLLLAISLTRAPLLVPLSAYQAVALTHFLRRRDYGLRGLYRIIAVVTVGTAAASGLAALLGPTLFRLALGERYHASAGELAGLSAGAGALGLLTLTGACCLAAGRHRAYSTGWICSTVVVVTVLLLPLPLQTRTVLSLLIGPLIGTVLHGWSIRSAPPRPTYQGALPAKEGMTRHAPSIRVSVCMATYCGAAYVEEQITSILEQLGPCDELIVVDDASTDATVELIAAIHDQRLRLDRNSSNLGYVRTFERALRLATGKYMFLADQDDVWLPGRVDAMLQALQHRAVVSTSVSVLGEPTDPPHFRLRHSDSYRHWANIFALMVGYRPYTGCAMGFRRDIYESVVPFPRFLYESHDLWLALVANTHRENVHLDAPSVARRLHDSNQTPLAWRGMGAIMRARWMKAKCLVVALYRARGHHDARSRRSNREAITNVGN